MRDDRADIISAINSYFDGLYEGDADKLASIFHRTGALRWEESGAVKGLDRDAWLQAIRTRESPRSLGLDRLDEIVSIDQASPTTAMAKVKCQIPPRFFTDYLNLLKIEGKWQIVQKVFLSEVRS